MPGEFLLLFVVHPVQPLSNLSTSISVSEKFSAVDPSVAVLYISENVMSQCAPLPRDNNKVPKVQVTLLHY